MSEPATSYRGPAEAKAPAGGLPVAVRRHPLVANVEQALTGRLTVPWGAKVVLGVSGGADSTALLLACAVLRGRESESGLPRVSPLVVHVNHQLREGAAEDARFVRELCEQLRVDYHEARVSPGEQPGNLAANAREMRYAAIMSAARAQQATLIATAHHAEDQLETMLMRLCRGAGPGALAGMDWQRALSADGLMLIRPLLGVRKAECESMCSAAGIEWREDPTNKDVSTARGRLRRDVLPVLEEMWPDASQRVASSAELLRAADAALEARLRATFGLASRHEWDRDQLAALDIALVASGLRRAALAISPALADQLNHAHVREAAVAIVSPAREPKMWCWPGGLTLRVDVRRVWLETDCERSAP